MARRAVPQELSRERILEEARVLFAQHGYRALTMRGIAKAMGYSHGALYYHFKEKAELFYAMVVDDFTRLLEREMQVLKQTEPGGIAALENMMLDFIRFGLDNPHHYEIMFLIDDPELRRYSRTEQAQCLELFAAVVRGVVDSRPNAAKRIYTLPWSLFMSLHGFITYNIQFHTSFEDVKNLAEDHVRNLCYGI